MADTDFIPGSFTVKSEVILKFFEALSILVFECRLHITKTGVVVIAVDSENIAIVEVTLNKFITLLYNREKETTFGVDVVQIHESLKNAKLADQVTISWYMDGDKKMLRIHSGRYTWVFNCLDVNGIRKDPNPPFIKLTTKFTSLGSVLVEGLQAVGVISDAVYIDVNAMSIVLEGIGDTSKCRYAISFDDGGTPARAKYSHEYLEDITKVLENALVSIEMASDHPISLAADDESGLPLGLKVRYLLAPRIDTE